MSTELTVLALAGLLQVGQIALMAIPANIELGVGKTLSINTVNPNLCVDLPHCAMFIHPRLCVWLGSLAQLYLGHRFRRDNPYAHLFTSMTSSFLQISRGELVQNAMTDQEGQSPIPNHTTLKGHSNGIL